MPDGFDVFLSHNSQDKPIVEEIGARLRGDGLRVWLDKWELRPGFPWQEGLEEGVQASRAVAVFVGKDGLGAWQEPEMRAFIARSRREKIPVIPVLLPGCPGSPQLTLFLEAFTWVDLRDGLAEDGLARLVWGITGAKPPIGPVPIARRPKTWWRWGIALSLLVLLAVAAWLWRRKPESEPLPQPPKQENGATRPRDEIRQEPEPRAPRQDDTPGAPTQAPASLPTKPALYAVRVQVFDPQGRPVEGATIRASVGNEPQRLPDGWWEVEISSAKVPASGRISLRADHKDWEGDQIELILGADPNPRAKIHLKEPETWLRGRVVDVDSRALSDVRVIRQDGAPGEATTDAEGLFALKLPVPRNTLIGLQALHEGWKPRSALCYAGRDTCSITLEER
jgi:hypothetical protein